MAASFGDVSAFHLAALRDALPSDASSDTTFSAALRAHLSASCVSPILTVGGGAAGGSSNSGVNGLGLGGGGNAATASEILMSNTSVSEANELLNRLGLDPQTLIAGAAARQVGAVPSASNGNWRCESCANVNYPRRVKCNRCAVPRGSGYMLGINNSTGNVGGFGNTNGGSIGGGGGGGVIGGVVGDKFGQFMTSTDTSADFCTLPANSYLNLSGTSAASMCTSATAADVLPSLNLLNCVSSSSPLSGPSPYTVYDQSYADALPSQLLQSPFNLPGSPGHSNCVSAPHMLSSSPLFGSSPMLTPTATTTTSGLTPHSATGGITPGGVTSSSAMTVEQLLPPPFSPLQVMLLKAKDVADKLLLDFQNLGDSEPTNKAVEVLKTALAMLGHPCDQKVGLEDNPLQGIGGPHFSAPTMLAHPDEFKNPSSFLKIYGDPLCGTGPGVGGNNPVKGQNGNWVCSKCQNINFPRRFRCNKCSEYRDNEGDEIVSEYAKTVYHQHLRTYKALAAKQGIDIPLKRFSNSGGGGSQRGSSGGGGSSSSCNTSTAGSKLGQHQQQLHASSGAIHRYSSNAAIPMTREMGRPN